MCEKNPVETELDIIYSQKRLEFCWSYYTSPV